jgi:beta-ketoacyl-acyl-carrier-protein synthase II
MEKIRVVVTGIGILSPVGNSVEEAWHNIQHGKSGIGVLNAESEGSEDTYIAGQIKDFDPVAVLGNRDARRSDPVTQYAMAAADQAIADSGIEITDDNRDDIGCMVGTCIGGVATLIDSVNNYRDRGRRGVSPLAIPRIMSDSSAANISIKHGIQGPNYSIASACATGNNVIGEALYMIRSGRAKVMVAGASDAALYEMVLAGFSNMKALSQGNGNPQHYPRPFDLNRDGFVSSEGAAVLILEALDHAEARGARIYGEIRGYGHTSDAYHITAPRDDGTQAAKAMEMALKDAELEPTQIDYINAHGTGTHLNDWCETLAIKQAIGEHAYDIPISATKSMTGHMLGAAGAAEAIFSLLSIRDNFVPPTINLDVADPDCDLDYTPHVGKSHSIEHIMSNSFGFGGHNAVLVISRYN